MNHQLTLQLLQELGEQVCLRVHKALMHESVERLSSIYKEGADDTIYTIDRDVEEVILPVVEKYAASLGGVWLLAEGIGDDIYGLALPHGIAKEAAALKIIMDPIDGTRGIMYNKRSAFFLAGAAPNKGEANTLRDIEVALITELPTSKSWLSDTLYAIKGQGAKGIRKNLLTGEHTPLAITPSKAVNIFGGFGQIARFFPPGRGLLAAIEDELVNRLLPDAPEGKTIVFEDQYISTGGQMYELLMGHDRYCADIRDLLNIYLQKQGHKKGHICHPYDICAFLIGEEAGLIFTDSKGAPFDASMNLYEDIGWIAYANPHIQAQVEPVLLQLLKEYQLL